MVSLHLIKIVTTSNSLLANDAENLTDERNVRVAAESIIASPVKP